ncbi:alpha/beta hydrolase [Lapillicoccus sp.]|uniref:alpha/beta hydrolase n=1 Tax=Lapillicoccus sp. TaxID=1909287 RepID=UPI003983B190
MSSSTSHLSGLPWRTRLFAALYDRTGALDVDGMDLDQIRAARGRVAPMVPPATWVTGAMPKGVRVTSSQLAARDGQSIPLRVYRPGHGAGPLPVIVFFHGGGWVLGNVRGYDALCGFLADSVEALVVSVDYRMAPEFVAPQAAYDCVDAVRWTASGVAALGGDPSRIAVSGDSAGGNLAAIVCQVVRDEGGPAISHQALLYPGVDGTQSFPSMLENAQAPILTKRQVDSFLATYTATSELPLDHPLISPLWAEDLTGLPPALVQTAQLDPLRDEGIAYAAALTAAGVPVRATTYVGAPHGFHSFPGATLVGPQARSELAAELRACLLVGDRATTGH